ncbi:hypothetical protein [Neobacillus sp.]|uniref:hypothetical protein n=1 Tax=Neobacillus sp. TaxID=2675273 RepID=UPI0028A1299F|nr:hypothetical protein [Neobacillus sp.]
MTILITVLFTVLFIIGNYYLIRNLVNLKMAADASKAALYPITESEFDGIIIPNEWKQMEPITKKTKSYRYVKWGTIASLGLLTILLVMVLTTDWFGSSYFSLAYLFFIIMKSVRHRGNLFILPKGIILNGKLVSYNQIKHYETEQIVRWHALYGLDEKVNNAFKLTFRLKRTIFDPPFIVVKNVEQFEHINGLLHQKGVKFKQNSPNRGA